MDQVNLSKMKVNELKKLAKDNNLRGYSKLKKMSWLIYYQH